MKRSTAILFLLLPICLFCQSEIELRTDGLVVPRLDSNTVINPSIGQIIYDTISAQLMYYDGLEWMMLSGTFAKDGSLIRLRAPYGTEDFLYGAQTMPQNDSLVSDTMFFFDQNKVAFRGGRLLNSSNWSSDSLGRYSFGYGFNVKANGDDGATALGSFTIASGDDGATALGDRTVASGEDGATALGDRTVASGDDGATALGTGTVASGNGGSTALGYETEAIGGQGATALGYETEASGDYGATALGEGTEASGDYGATALGEGTKASGDNGATALGIRTIASGDDGATALGYNTVAIGDDGATALGYNTVAIGDDGATALGDDTIASGDGGATALGTRTIASGDNGATALGNGTHAAGNSCLAVGVHNDTLVSSGTSVGDSGPLFIIGNGDDVDNRSNAMVVRKNGNVTIGSDSSSAKLEIKSDGDTLAPHLLLLDDEVDGRVFARMSNIGASPDSYWEMNSSAFAAPPNNVAHFNFYYKLSDKVVLKLKGNGNATLDGNLTQNSDRRLKTDIKVLENPMINLQGLSGYRYLRKDQVDSGIQIGLVAQEVQQIYPELVASSEDGILSVNYSKFIPVLLEAIKHQQKEIEELEARLQKAGL